MVQRLLAAGCYRGRTVACRDRDCPDLGRLLCRAAPDRTAMGDGTGAAMHGHLCRPERRDRAARGLYPHRRCSGHNDDHSLGTGGGPCAGRRWCLGTCGAAVGAGRCAVDWHFAAHPFSPTPDILSSFAAAASGVCPRYDFRGACRSDTGAMGCDCCGPDIRPSAPWGVQHEPAVFAPAAAGLGGADVIRGLCPHGKDPA